MSILEKFQKYAELKSELHEYCYDQIKAELDLEGGEYGEIYIWEIIPVGDTQFLCEYDVSRGKHAGGKLLHDVTIK